MRLWVTWRRLAIPLGGTYNTTEARNLWRLPLYWMVYGAVPSVAIVIVGTLIFPIPAGKGVS